MRVLAELIEYTVARFPNNVAINYNQENISYPDLRQKINIIASYLLDNGINYQTKVAVFLPSSPLFVATFFAIAKIGAVAVTFNISYKEDELSNYLKALRINYVILTRQAENRYGKAMQSLSIKAMAFDSCPKLIPHPTRKQDNNTRVNPNNEVLCQFSSGSTGKSKLAVRTHYNILSEAENVCKTIGISGKDRLFCSVPLFHAYGFGTAMTSSIYVGATLILINKFNPRKVLNMLKKEKATMFFGVPYMFSLLADILSAKKINFPHLKYCFSAGISLPAEVSKRFYRKFGVFVRDLYGTTETGCISVNLNKDVRKTLDSVGLPIEGTKVNIIGEDGEKARIGETGEIIVKTPTCGRWYYIDNARKLITKNGYLYTGDIGKKDIKGNLCILGRKTLFINVAGAKVDPKEVEEIIIKYPGVKEVVVVGYPDKLRGEVVKAVVVLKNKSILLDKNSLLKYCREKLADFKVPRIVEFKDKLPKSSLGKILKGYL